MAVELVLNFILSGINKVLKSLKFNFRNLGGTLIQEVKFSVHIAFKWLN